MSIATTRSFQRSKSPGDRITISSPLGIFTAKDADEADRICDEILSKMKLMLGREPTADEALLGPMPFDDRSEYEKALRKASKPVLTNTKHPMTRLAESLRGESADHQMNGVSRNERIARDAESIADRDAEQSVDQEAEKKRLEKLAPELQHIDRLINEEKWRCDNGSMKMLDLLETFKEQLVARNGDAKEIARRRKAVRDAIDERAARERTAAERRMNVLQAEMQAIKDGSMFADPEPEPVPDELAQEAQHWHDEAARLRQRNEEIGRILEESPAAR